MISGRGAAISGPAPTSSRLPKAETSPTSLSTPAVVPLLPLVFNSESATPPWRCPCRMPSARPQRARKQVWTDQAIADSWESPTTRTRALLFRWPGRSTTMRTLTASSSSPIPRPSTSSRSTSRRWTWRCRCSDSSRKSCRSTRPYGAPRTRIKYSTTSPTR